MCQLCVRTLKALNTILTGHGQVLEKYYRYRFPVRFQHFCSRFPALGNDSILNFLYVLGLNMENQPSHGFNWPIVEDHQRKSFCNRLERASDVISNIVLCVERIIIV